MRKEVCAMKPAASTEEMSATMHSVLKATNRLKDIADALQKKAGIFKLN